jgi:arylsulfatase A-like enzyme
MSAPASRAVAGRRVDLAAALLALMLAGCDERLTPTRGIVLVSIDTLRADRLGCYGHSRDTSPFLDTLAARGVLFEQAIAQYPSTMTSHMSIFTGLYPAEHGVFAPAGRLAESIPTVPELLQRAGFRTGGFTEAGQMRGEHGFARGFDRFDDEIQGRPDDVATTFARGLEFLRSVAPGDRFFLFLHTYAVHTPYDPPPPYDSLYWPGEPPAGLAPTGRNILYLNSRLIAPEPAVVDYYRALYDGSIRQVDDRLRDLYAEIESLGLADELTLIVTSDHGEEFLEHGRLAHTQIYRETVHVPLVVLSPGIRGARRVAPLVESLDLAPTLLELAGLRPPEMSGRSLLGWLTGGAATPRGHGYSEVSSAGIPVRSLHHEGPAGLFQLVHARLDPATPRERIAAFDVGPAGVELGLRSFRGAPRRIEIQVDGEPDAAVELAGDDERRVVVPAAPAAPRRRVRLAADSCTPSERAHPYRDCYAFHLSASQNLQRIELFALAGDPLAQRDVWADHASAGRQALQLLGSLQWRPRGDGREVELDDEARRQLEALGYL